MSQIWCYLLLSMILGLCGSAVLNEDSALEYQITDEITDSDENILENPHTDNKFPKFLDEFENVSGEKLLNEKTNSRNNPNKAKEGKDCYYPYRSSTPLYCSYFVQFGERTDGDK